jgi:hypothetical protein
MLLNDFCDFLPKNSPFTLKIETSKASQIFNINKATYNKNVLSTPSANILFTTPNEEKLVFDKIKGSEVEYLITKLNSILGNLNLPESISVYHFDQVFNRDLFKLYKNPLKLTHIVSGNAPIYPKKEGSMVTLQSNAISLVEMDSKIYHAIIAKELKNSLVFVRVKKDGKANIQAVYSILAQYSNIINYDSFNRVFTINLTSPIDFHILSALGVGGQPVAVMDRSTELFQYIT